MPSGPKNTGTTPIPTMRSRDAPAAIEWVCRAFGFERPLVVPGPDGTVAHAELSFGSGTIVLGSVGKGRFDRLMAMPDEAGGRCTQALYAVVADVDAHHDRAAGARIVAAPRDEAFDGRRTVCRDPEGHAWWFASRDPWAGQG